jgi:carboxymethylenebutenolidase
MGNFVELKSADGFVFPAYVAQAAGASKGAVVVLQEIFGVNSHIQQVSDRLAAQGYLVVAPATFERVKPGVDLGYTEADMHAGIALKSAVESLPADGVMPDIQAAIDYAAKTSGGKVAIMGFCWGGLLTWRSANALTGLSAAVPYYGGGMVAAAEIALQPKCAVLAHFSDRDHSVPMEGVTAFQAAHPQVQSFVYSADHGFNCDHRGAYDEAAATAAQQRTLAFLAEKLA